VVFAPEISHRFVGKRTGCHSALSVPPRLDW
jgi:hypothetical protein